ncbi:hypothetical protein I5F56_00145 [Pseudomonas aeruginosa]|nr:hypothetical protein [Pseudomonas aeruginosa]
MSMELNKESVEQAGGDRWDALQSIMEWTAAENIPDDRKLCLIRNAARAALAQPSPKREQRLVECDACPTSGGCVEKCMKAPTQPSPALPPFAEKVLAKLRRFYDCASDFESGGVDIGRHWLDLLTQLGLLNRVQRSPALWEISQQGEDLLGAPQHFPARTEQANSGYDQLWAWFGLSRSAYAVLPRVMMHAMPDEWQGRFAELMDEWDDHWPNQPDITAHVQIKQNNRFISTPPWLLNYRHPDHNQLNAMRGKDEL